nr:MAG: hypothetical protein [Microvirus sp.]
MRYKIVVRHKGGNVSRYEFPARSAWADHYLLYVREVDDGYFISVELWKRINAVVTGEPGEKVWQLVARHPRGN